MTIHPRASILISFTISTDDWEPEQYDAHFGKWLRVLLKEQFIGHDVQGLQVKIASYYGSK